MKAKETYLYDKLTWPEMNDAIELQKVVILPTGSTEQHGRHLPLDVDLFLVESVCHELGRQAPGPGASSSPSAWSICPASGE